MTKKDEFYELINDFFDKGLFETLSNHCVIAVELPAGQGVNYITVAAYDSNGLGIKFLKGTNGLLTLAMNVEDKARTADFHQRSEYISLVFRRVVEITLSDWYIFGQEEKVDNQGYPQFSFKEKGFGVFKVLEKHVDEIIQVLKAVTSVKVEKLRPIKTFNKQTKLLTLYKKGGKWRSKKGKIKTGDEKIEISQFEVYTLLKKTKLIDELWHMTSVYDEILDLKKETLEYFGAPCFPGRVSIFSASGKKINTTGFLGSAGEVPTLKKVLMDTFEAFEVRPKVVITDLKLIYYCIKDFLKAFGIKTVYDPKDFVLVEYIDEVLDSGLEDFDDQEE